MPNTNAPQPQLCMQCNNLNSLPQIELPQGYKLRTATPEDGENWARIIGESFLEPRTVAEYEALMRAHPSYRPDRLFFIDAPDGTACATAAAYRDAENLTGKQGYVHYVGVCPAHQGKRLGYWASLAVLRKFALEGCTNAILHTDDFRIPAIKTYLKLGFKPLINHPSHRKRWHNIMQMLNINREDILMIGNEHVKLHPKCSWLPFETNSWITKLAGGSLLAFEAEKTVDANGVEGAVPYVSVSSDGGQSWERSEPLNFAPETAPHFAAEPCITIQTPSGALVALYRDIVNMKWDWDAETNTAGESTKLDVWSCRSEDGGKTWQDCSMVVEGWCGALIDIKLLSDGRIAATAMNLLYKEGRHTCFTLVSEDDGKTWQKGNIIDFGGSGDHDGAMEPTFVELSDGKYYMLIRTNFDYFWEAYSDDCLNWLTLRKSSIDASSSPGHLLRLASGRIVLVWSRLKKQGQSEVKRYTVPHMTRRPASWQRRELSIAFSDDECKSWSEPVVLARNELDIDAEQQMFLGQISYPYLLEYEPGDLWVIARAPTGGPINFRLNEADFCG